MSTPPPSKRPRTAESSSFATAIASENPSAQVPIAPRTAFNTAPPPPTVSPSNPRKRKASHSPRLNTLPPVVHAPPEPSVTVPPPTTSTASVSIPALLTEDSGKKRGRTNTPWTAAEEQRLKQMRDAGHSWSEIAKAFPNRTEGSVKKHWYKDMHYAEFAEDETKALLEAIKEYDANKWKVIGQKLGKPAKACEQFAKDHFKN